MARTIAIGEQSFEKIRNNNNFYIDKTHFIKEWWENGDSVTLINRPRRFGKTLTMDMVNCFFSVEHKNGGGSFEGLDIWKEDKYRQLQGTYPVIFLSFAKIKDTSFDGMYDSICTLLYRLLMSFGHIFKDSMIEQSYHELYNKTLDKLFHAQNGAAISDSLNALSEILAMYYGKKVIILLDEYDTPMHEAYLNGYWDEAVQFFRSMFNATFKTNPFMERAIITGITRVSKESMFSDLNNLEVVTSTSTKYANVFGFTETEVFAAMDEIGMTSKDEMKSWYDGFIFGNVSDIYNPWSVINALDKKKYQSYWVNSSSNALLNSLVRRGSAELKTQVEELLKGNGIKSYIDEEIVYNQLDADKEAVWGFMLASGYLKVDNIEKVGRLNKMLYTLSLPNLEVEGMFHGFIEGWFKGLPTDSYNDFIKALLLDDVEAMNDFMNDIALNSFSSFDIAKNASSKDAPERFYHGFVLGLMVDLDGRYEIKSNRESGFGRYDIMLVPSNKMKDKAYIIEFKVKKQREVSIEDTLKNALAQIDEKQYAHELIMLGIPKENIRKYGFAFEGKNILIG